MKFRVGGFHTSQEIRDAPRRWFARANGRLLYGFGTAYRFTHDAQYLATAEACADFYLEHTPA
ncbi:MAG: hypothetical protein M1598_05125, partial [Actinobacteria bacterium]|nr:hypothetical protein [Actinomycetota bacterium]